MKKSINPSAMLFPEFKGERIESGLYESRDYPHIETDEEKQLKSVVYAVNPVTGHPSSDLATVMSKDTNPEVARYIRDNLLQSRQDSGTLDVDEALASVKTQNMSSEEYQNQLLRYIDKKQKTDK